MEAGAQSGAIVAQVSFVRTAVKRDSTISIVEQRQMNQAAEIGVTKESRSSHVIICVNGKRTAEQYLGKQERALKRLLSAAESIDGPTDRRTDVSDGTDKTRTY